MSTGRLLFTDVGDSKRLRNQQAAAIWQALTRHDAIVEELVRRRQRQPPRRLRPGQPRGGSG